MGRRAAAPSLSQRDADSLADFVRRGGTFCAQLPPGSALAHLAWALRARSERPLVLVTDGPKTLDALYEDLGTLRPPEAAEPAYYPAWESLPGRGALPTPDLLGDRLHTLHRLQAGGPPLLIVTCVQALMQRTPAPAGPATTPPVLRRGGTYELPELLERLQVLGYDFQPEVAAKGQASQRGGVLDVWPVTADWPVRAEFFGSEVETLRTFDPHQQRSREDLAEVALAGAGDPFEDLTSDFAAHLPPDAVWIWVDEDGIAQHAALYEEVIQEAQAGTWTVAFETFQARVADAPRLRLGLADTPDGARHTFDFSPVNGLPNLGGAGLRPDLLEEARAQLLANLRVRVAAGWTVRIYFATEGARDRFAETLGGDGQGSGVRVQWSGFELLLGALSEGYESAALQLCALSESDFYGRRKEQRGRYDLHARRGPARLTGERLYDAADLQPGQFVVHIDHGIGKYLGLFEIEMGGERQEVLTVEYADGARLYVPVAQAHLLSRYVGMGRHRPTLHKLGGQRWSKEKVDAERSVQDFASLLLRTQALRDAQPGHAFSADTPWQHEFEAAFPYRETPDQEKAIADVKADMEKARPMDRLVCGDVGYGKTEVAMRAAFKTVMDGKQVAMLVPTTVLAQQHFDTFSERMAAYPVRIAALSRFESGAEQNATLDKLAEGEVDIVIGTHRLVQKDVTFKDLGLVIIDEEQRFGVKHKEHLKHVRTSVDVLTLTATPIPRTLYLGLTGARDLSVIATPPVERLPVETIVAENTDEVVRRAILHELNREGQVFFLHNRVQTIERAWERLRRLVPEARIEIAHGQMNDDQLGLIMHAFVRGDFDVLLCTTIIESGLDIPNVNTILIERADRFGLAELYQLRGRVGRYKRKAYAYLLLPKHGLLFDVARKRIGALKRHAQLGAGFQLALRDLEIRGAGNLLGAEQSGHIGAVGFDLYCQLLQRTVAQMKGEKPPPVIDVEVRLDFLELAPGAAARDGAAVIPPALVEDESQRIRLYRRLAGVATAADLEAIRQELRDRFGRMPPALDRLLKVSRLRLEAAAHRIQKVETQEDKVLLYRRGEPITVGNRLPRLTARQPGARLDELVKIIRACG
jgi:transcription-repair coupling factor (superfamily II helicase)